MKMLFKTTLATAVIAAFAALPASAQQARQPAAPAAPAPVGTLIPGMAVANFEGAVVNSDAFRAAAQQRPTTYKATLDAYQARGQALQAQLQPMVDKFNRDKAASNPNQASLQQQAIQIQQFQENAQQEMNELIRPVVYSEQYAKEQVEERLEAAVRSAMNQKRISILLDGQVVLAVNNNAYDLNPTIIAELNRLIPTVGVVPPAGWEPRQIREAKAQQAQQAGQQGQPAAPAAPRPTVPAGPPADGR